MHSQRAGEKEEEKEDEDETHEVQQCIYATQSNAVNLQSSYPAWQLVRRLAAQALHEYVA